MNVSMTAVNLIAKYEGFSPTAYLCPANVWTIGYGTTVYANGKKVAKGDTITKSEALKLFTTQVDEHASTIFTYVQVPLNQNQYDALASFQYNCGKYILKNSTLLEKINAEKWEEAMTYLKMYNKGGGKVLAGLVKRRNEEAELFLKDVDRLPTYHPSKIDALNYTKLECDGYLGVQTIKRLQQYLKVTQTGVMDKTTVKALQKLVGVVEDGIMGPATVKALQRRLNTPQDGIISKPSIMVKTLQNSLNKNKL